MSRVFLVIRAQLLREGLRKLLTDASFSVVGEASTPDDAVSFFALNGEEDISLIVSEASVCYESPDFLKTLRQVACKARIVILANQEDVPRLGHQNIIAADGVLSLQISAEVMAQSLRVMQLGERTVPTEFIMSLVGPQAFNPSDTAAPAETADVHSPPESNCRRVAKRNSAISGEWVYEQGHRAAPRHHRSDGEGSLERTPAENSRLQSDTSSDMGNQQRAFADVNQCIPRLADKYIPRSAPSS